MNRKFLVLSLLAALQARHNTDVPGNLERTDTLASVNIVWSPHAKSE
jgi:putative salt-induced outer membrane protein YdiY